MKDGSIKSIKRPVTILGEGGQGKVYLAIDDEGNKYAIKMFDLSKYQ